ncbi:MAG: DEAD/DEAH box helicase [Treponema sp.]|nr:DEAD/DEAH box helicase [Treponema sp.]
MDFTEFSLNKNLLEGIEKAGYITCTPVQEHVIAGSLNGADLYVQSQTGTGKTAAYLVSIIQQLLERAESKNKKAIILVPTRELAVQVEQEAKILCHKTKLKVASFYGGVGYTRQIENLKKNIDIIVGTPGRIIDLVEQQHLIFDNITFLIVDEADRMFDMGFYPDLRKLIKFLPKSENRQTMLFSATLNNYVKNLAWEFTREPKEITIESENITVEEIDQLLLHVSSDAKMRLLLGVLKNEKPESVIIFCNTKKSCEIVSKRLQINGIENKYIIGDLPQNKRLEVLNNFKNGKLTCLVATDVAARGIDVNNLAMVINYDLPNEAENYVHRIGRTARAGKSGKAYTFCSEQDVYNLIPIERYIDMNIPSEVAFEDQMVEDASKNIYIKLESYDDDEEKVYKRHDKNKLKDTRSKNFNDKNRNYKKQDSRTDIQKTKPVEKFDESLIGLSFEERMKKYKEKYGQGSFVASKNDDTKKDYETSANQDVNISKTNAFRIKNNSKQNIGTKKQNTDFNQKNEPTKKGLNSLTILERIKLFFKK